MLPGINMHRGLHWAHHHLNEQTMQKSGLHNHAEPKSRGYEGGCCQQGQRSLAVIGRPAEGICMLPSVGFILGH